MNLVAVAIGQPTMLIALNITGTHASPAGAQV